MIHFRIIKTYDYSWDGAYIAMDDAIWNRLQTYARRIPVPSKSRIIAETVLALSCTMLFEIVCKCTHNPLQERLRGCLHCHGRCNIKSFAEVRMTHPGPTKIYDCSRDGAYIVMDDAFWNRFLNCHGRYYLKSFVNVPTTHSRTIEICDCSIDSADIVMDDAIWNHL